MNEPECNQWQENNLRNNSAKKDAWLVRQNPKVVNAKTQCNTKHHQHQRQRDSRLTNGIKDDSQAVEGGHLQAVLVSGRGLCSGQCNAHFILLHGEHLRLPAARVAGECDLETVR